MKHEELIANLAKFVSEGQIDAKQALMEVYELGICTGTALAAAKSVTRMNDVFKHLKESVS